MSSPIHVHVQDNTPLHVHVKKPKKAELKEASTARNQSNVRHSVRSGPRGRLKPANDPWIPAPGRTSMKDKLDKQYKWESTRSQLEVHGPHQVDLNVHPIDEIPLKTSDLSTEEDSRLRAHLSEYERKIENLMAEVGTLKNEANNMSKMISQNSQCLRCSPKPNSISLCHGDSEKPKQVMKVRHTKCFKQPNQVSEVEWKVNRAFSKMVKSAEKNKNPTTADKKRSGKKLVSSTENLSTNKEANIPKNLLIPTSAKSEPLLFLERSHRTDFEKRNFRPIDCAQPACQKMELKKIEGELERRDEALEASHAALQDKDKELNFLSREYQETEKENLRLRKSVENFQDNLATSLKDVGDLPTDKDSLLHQLVEVEVNGTEAGKQVAALRDVASRLKYEKRLAISDVNQLSKQRDLLLQKLEQFEVSNRKVRRLLQLQHKTIGDVQRLEEQRDILMKKMADSDSELLRMRSELIQKRNDVEQLTAQVSEEKNHARTLNELNKSVEATRAHLQRELRAKEMENNRLHVQLKNMERESETTRREAEELTAVARNEREMIAREKEGLKKATRSQRNRAEKAEDEMKRLEGRLEDRERKLEEARSQADAWRDRYQRTSDEKGRLDDHVQSLAQKASDLESMLRTNELMTQSKEDDYRSKIDRLMSENSALRSDAERNRKDCALAEDRSKEAEKEAGNLRAEIRQRETVESELRTQLRKAKNEAEEALLSAERVERSSRRMRDDGNNEIERVKEQMLDRMRDLQPLPELLKETEMKLQDAQDKLHVFEQRSAEQTRIIADLTNKTEDRADETSSLRQRIAALSDENRALEARLQILQVKLDDRDVRVKETVLDTVGKDERIQQLQLKLEEANHEKLSFKRQLEASVADSRKAVESEVEKAAAREHAAQARIIDLETAVTRLKTDVASIKRTKEDAERRNQSKLQDAKDRLEQAESTNRSMRNYVNFLKTSYNNVFGGDVSLTSTPVRHQADRSPY